MGYLFSLLIVGVLAAIVPVLVMFAGYFLEDMLDLLRGVVE